LIFRPLFLSDGKHSGQAGRLVEKHYNTLGETIDNSIKQERKKNEGIAGYYLAFSINCKI
jgi:hypothetical protein